MSSLRSIGQDAVVWPALVDGELCPDGDAKISARDDGLLRGDGVYEVIRVYDGVAFVLDEHLERIRRSCATLRIHCDLHVLAGEVARLVAATPVPTFDLRLVLTRGGARLALAEPPRHVGGSALRLLTVRYAPSLVLEGAKTLSYAANMHATRLAREQGFDEALLVTLEGAVLEAPTASLFWAADDGVLRTPPLSEHILDSITRRVIVGRCDAIEARCHLDELSRAREIFLASTTREVQAVADLDGVQLTAPGPLTSRAAEAFRSYVHEQVVRFGCG